MSAHGCSRHRVHHRCGQGSGHSQRWNGHSWFKTATVVAVGGAVMLIVPRNYFSAVDTTAMNLITSGATATCVLMAGTTTDSGTCLYHFHCGTSSWYHNTHVHFWSCHRWFAPGRFNFQRTHLQRCPCSRFKSYVLAQSFELILWGCVDVICDVFRDFFALKILPSN
jgi:hypothetical protein